MIYIFSVINWSSTSKSHKQLRLHDLHWMSAKWSVDWLQDRLDYVYRDATSIGQ